MEKSGGKCIKVGDYLLSLHTSSRNMQNCSADEERSKAFQERSRHKAVRGLRQPKGIGENRMND